MHWILQENLFKEAEWDNLVTCLERFNIPYSVHKVVPFSGDLIPFPQNMGNKADCKVNMFSSRMCQNGTKSCDVLHKVICFGSYSMRHAAAWNGWSPGVYDLMPQDFTVQMQHWGDLMLNADAEVCEFQHADIFEDTFIRPITDSKYFAGKVFDVEEFYTWKRNVCVLNLDYGNSLKNDTLIQLCKPKKIYSEYRFWIVNQKVVSASMYKRGDTVIYSSDVDRRFYDFANQVLRTKDCKYDIRAITENCGWRPADAFVLDICETPEGMKVVEINTINASGFYAGNVQDIVLALEQMEKSK
jgi:hypothetical protein